jgi:hypothetical protein
MLCCASKTHIEVCVCVCVQIQCQMWLDNILRDLLEAKRLGEDQAKCECHE